MAPPLATSQHAQIQDMLISKSLTSAKIAKIARCSVRSVNRIRSNLCAFGNTKAPCNGGGRRKSISPVMLDALVERLLIEPGLYLEEMTTFLRDEFRVNVAPSTISRTLASIGWSRKATRRISKARSADLRDYYLYRLSDFRSFHLIYVDESGCDKRTGFRRKGWAPLGVTPIRNTPYQREGRYQILPAYTQDGLLLSRVFQGSTDSAIFEGFVRELLPYCGRWPEPKSVLVMDNASFHHCQELEHMCRVAGVKILYLPPYSPDFNPIEEFFAELKAFIKRYWYIYERYPEKMFGSFLEWCVSVVGSQIESARGHFRHAGWTIEEP